MCINTKVELLKEALISDINEIEKIDNYNFREICLFALAEQYANDFNKVFERKCKGNKIIFVKFIEKYCFYDKIKKAML